jgi:transposase
MSGFVEGLDRRQTDLLPAALDDYVDEDNQVRVIDVFVDELDLQKLGFERVQAAATGRPGYSPGCMLKLYLYGYLNQVQSSRRLEREARRNTELMWLTGKLAPDFKTIADFRRDNGEAIRQACSTFVAICRGLGLLAGGVVAVDGSRFKAVNTRDKNFTPGAVRRRIEQAEASIARYLQALDTADRQEGEAAELRGGRIRDRLAALRRQVRDLQAVEAELATAPDHQISRTDPDARAMATNGKGTGLVGYNVQAVVDAEHHLIVAHEVTNQGHDRSQLANMTRQAQAATGDKALRVLADRGYFSGEEIRACEQAGATPYLPKPMTSGAKADGRFSKADFVYLPDEDVYRCPAGRKLVRHMETVEHGMTLRRYWDAASCSACAIKGRCTTGKERRVTRWEHEAIIDAMQNRLDREPLAMRTRRKTVEHVFGTLKAWMGATHFKTKRLKNVASEMSLHVLAYNLKRVIAILGVRPLISALQV